ncbi:MAG TPA: cytochrome c peroxidase [Xanthomonadaceae bacterium]|nr:cytochrome c peroxidase [Xanthomonadaceae bacterium]
MIAFGHAFILRGTCALVLSLLATAASPQSFTGSMSGTWWNPARNGEGQFITFEQLGDRSVVVLAYFTYDAHGNASWKVGNTDFSPGTTSISFPTGTGSGPRFGVGFRPGDASFVDGGTVTLSFIACDRLGFAYVDETESFAFEIQRLVGPLDGEACDGSDTGPAASTFIGSLSGGWWDPERSGEGTFIAFERVGERRVASLFYFTYDDQGQPGWLVGNIDYGADATRIEIPLIKGSGARFGEAFDTADVRIDLAGRATIENMGCDGMRFRYTGHVTFGLNFSRLVGDLIDTPCTLESAPPLFLDNQLRMLIAREGLTGDPSRGRELPGIDAPLAQLGKLLFFSKTLSAEFDVSCATCHHPALGGGDGLALSIGAGAVEPDVVGPGRRLADNSILVGRNANTIFNIGLYDASLFWDSRIESLGSEPGQNGAASGIRTPDTTAGVADPQAGGNLVAAQARFPGVGPAEMLGTGFPGMSDAQIRAHLAARIGNYGSGAGLLPPSQWLERFQTAFDSDAGPEQLITFDNIALAIGEYQRSAVFVESPWARYVRGDNAAISQSAKAGALFFFRRVDEGGTQCSQCHSGDFFTDERHHVLGFPQVGPGMGDGGNGDFGRGRETGLDADRFAFRTPSLLNIELGAPYGHAGAYGDFHTVLDHYAVPQDTINTFLLARRWCTLPPFNSDPNCAAAVGSVQSNTLAALARMEAIRASDPANGMPLINIAAVPISAVPQMIDFMRSLTDPCLRDRACFGRWIPTPGEAPDAFQLNAVNGSGEPW